MAGHSKWSNIKRKKEINDKKKSKILNKLVRKINTFKAEGNIGKLKILAASNNIKKKVLYDMLKKKEQIDYTYILINFDSVEIIVSFKCKKNILINSLNNKLKNVSYRFIDHESFTGFNSFYILNLKNDYNEKCVLDNINELNTIHDFVDNNITMKYKFEKIIYDQNIRYTMNSFFLPKNIVKINNSRLQVLLIILNRVKSIPFFFRYYTNTSV